MKVRSDEFKGSGIVSCENVGVIFIVVENCPDWSGEIYVNFGQSLFVTNDDVSDDMDIKVISVIKSNVKLLLSQSVFTSEITGLFQMKAFD
jgi:uncharacterized membrane protein